MKKIEFRAGYYEWHLFIDEELVYYFLDMEWSDYFRNIDELKDFASECVDVIDEEAKLDESERTNFCDRYGTQQENKELWLSLTKEEKEQVKQAIVKGWSYYIDVDLKSRSFDYKGYYFRPIGNLSGNWVQKNQQLDFNKIIKIDGYTHKDFYKEAKKHHASCDVFEIDENYYVPCNAGFVSVIKNARIKSLDCYSRWYH